MEKLYENPAARWKDAANLVLGLWLAASPWILPYDATSIAIWNAHAVGVVIAVAAGAALISFHKWEERINIALAIWLIMSPFLLGYGYLAYPMWNQVVVGMLAGTLATWTMMDMDIVDSREQSVKKIGGGRK